MEEPHASYESLRANRACVREEAATYSEDVLQRAWRDGALCGRELKTEEGHRITVLAPGWWNRQEGPDFKGAQIEFNGVLCSGDVELHLRGRGWTQHGHDEDPRYRNVILHVVLEGTGAAATSDGRGIPTLVAGPLLIAGGTAEADTPSLAVRGARGACSALIPAQGIGPLRRMLHLAGDWRMLEKASRLRERMERVGPAQAIYEAILYACGYSAFKHEFQTVARQFPYERARQLALQDPFLLEAALLRIAGLLPNSPEDGGAAPHLTRLRRLWADQLAGLQSLPLTWRRYGVRPNNSPERRLAGAALLIARTAKSGLHDALEEIWREELTPIARRRRFEGLFPGATGFWAAHCTWNGKRLEKPSAPIGGGRVRSIIGNVIVPSAFAEARARRNRVREEQVLAFYAALPREPANRIEAVMIPRLLDGAEGLPLDFRTQQGLLQFYEDWCEPNPSCRHCAMHGHLDQQS